MKHILEALYGSVEVEDTEDGLLLTVNGEVHYLDLRQMTHVFEVLNHEMTAYLIGGMEIRRPELRISWDDDTGLSFQTYLSHNVYGMHSALLSNEEALTMRNIFEEALNEQPNN